MKNESDEEADRTLQEAAAWLKEKRLQTPRKAGLDMFQLPKCSDPHPEVARLKSRAVGAVTGSNGCHAAKDDQWEGLDDLICSHRSLEKRLDDWMGRQEQAVHKLLSAAKVNFDNDKKASVGEKQEEISAETSAGTVTDMVTNIRETARLTVPGVISSRRLGTQRRSILSQQLATAVAEATEDSKNVIMPTRSIGLAERVRIFLQSPLFEGAVMGLLGFNIVFMSFQLHYEGLVQGHDMEFVGLSKDEVVWPGADQACYWIERIFTMLFLFDVGLRVTFFGLEFWKDVFNYIDVLVVVGSILTSSFPFVLSPMFLRLLRFGKLVRALRMVRLSTKLDTLQLILRCLIGSVTALFWSLMLLLVVQVVAGLMISSVSSSFADDRSKPFEKREEIYKYWGTFDRTILSMFEILFANWAPVARALIDNVSVHFISVFLFYRCFVGFAVLNVVNAVFVQQTMKVVQADERVVLKQRQEAKEAFIKNMNRAFTDLDKSGDGVINIQEYSALLQDDKLKLLLSQLDINTTDMAVLFTLLDTSGDGEISMTEFSEGVAKLKGPAMNLDILRLLHNLRHVQDSLQRLEER